MAEGRRTNDNEIKKWIVDSETHLLTTPVFGVRKRHYTPPDDGSGSDFFVIEAPDWVNIIAKTTDEEFILVRQYRFGIDQVSLEIPGGIIDPEDGEPLNAARRELAEETGYTSKNWTLLGRVSSNPAIFTNYCHTFLAEQCVPERGQKLDPHERIQVVTMPFAQLEEALNREVIHHSLVVAAFGEYLLHQERTRHGK